MNNIDDENGAGRALEPIPASQIKSYQGEIEFAQLMAKAKILPAHLHGNPGNCLAVITMAQSWNMNPIMVGLKTSVIPKKGGGETLMFEGQLVNAAITNSGKLQGRLKFNMSGNGPDTICEVVGLLKGETEARTVTVGMPRTQNSPLWSGNQGDKEQQLSYLAARMWCRRHAPEILLGVYTPEDPWEEREPDAVIERRAAVQSRIAALESNPPIYIPTGKDDFIGNIGVQVGGAVDNYIVGRASGRQSEEKTTVGAALENNQPPVMPTGKDDFIDIGARPVKTIFKETPAKAVTESGIIDIPEDRASGFANVVGGVMSLEPGTYPGKLISGNLPQGSYIMNDISKPGDSMDATVKYDKVVSIDTEEPDPLDEPIPDFGSAKCRTCGGRGLLENANGDKEPCPNCSGK